MAKNMPPVKEETPKTKTTSKKATEPTLQEFWGVIKEIRKEIEKDGYGSEGGGRTFKDTNKLLYNVKPLFEKHDLIYDISPIDRMTIEPAHHITNQGQASTHYLVGGTYHVRWFLRGVLVYETSTIGSANLQSAAQATGGSVTNARTNAMFSILDANVKSEEEYEAELQKQNNTQAKRQPAGIKGNARPF